MDFAGNHPDKMTLEEIFFKMVSALPPDETSYDITSVLENGRKYQPFQGAA